jgi:hypothetical protein
VYVSDYGNHRIQVFELDGTFVSEWGDASVFGTVASIAVDADGGLITNDIEGLRKWTPQGDWIWTFGLSGEYGFDIDGYNNIYVCNGKEGRLGGNITKYHQTLEFVYPVPDYTFVDADNDGLTDTQETDGWDIIITDASATSARTEHVTSDPLAPDTDFDGLLDSEEAALLTDPRSLDSDDDGLSDSEELEIGTDPTSWDTDGDGLGDVVEVGCGSDPKDQDSDSDGLSDYQEFLIDSNPNSNDTDRDGLADLDEVGYGADPKDPDPDGDSMFDGQEFELGANPLSPDTDSDGMDDGYEVLFGTDVVSGDSDGDGLSDGFEVSSRMNPLNKDTDHDGIEDSRELELGLNPRNGDSDGDGVPDSLDQDCMLELDGEIVLCYDEGLGAEELEVNLSKKATVRVVSADKLLESYRSSRYVVLVGNPEGANGTAGGVICDLLEDSGDVLERMKESEQDRMAVRHGAWNSTQTIVMLSIALDDDWMRVLGTLKSMHMTVSDRSVLVEYNNPRSCFLLDQEDLLKATDTYVWTKLDNMTTFKVSVEKLTDDEVSISLAKSDALSSGEAMMDKYVRIEFQQTGSGAAVAVLGTSVRIYYTIADLDLNGDGDADDPGDLNESHLELFVMSDDGTWVRLSNIANATGVNTVDVVVYGKEYAGYVWANVSSLSLFGIAGLTEEGVAGGGTSWMLVASAALAAVVLVAAAFFVFWIRKKKGPPLDESQG